MQPMTEAKPIHLVKNGAADLLSDADAALERCDIDDAEWYRRVAAFTTPRYLATTTPWQQSGRSGGAASWEHARGLIADGMCPGRFLDVGCANGYLMECLERWCAGAGIEVEFYGLDISPELVALAKERLPQWRNRFFVGNAIEWVPEDRFTVVRTGLEYVPAIRQRTFVEHLISNVVAPGGRLLIGVYNEERKLNILEEQLIGWGFNVTGRTQRDHIDPRLAYKIVWVKAQRV